MNLLITGAFNYYEAQLAEMKRLFNNVFFVQDERIPLDRQNIAFDVSEINAAVCNALFLHNDLSMFKSLRFVQLTSAGFDRVPLNEMRSKGIIVENAKGVYRIPMAEWAILKILEIYKNSWLFFKAQEDCRWIKQRNLLELTDKVVAIFGLGAVGSEVAKRLRPFGCRIIGVDPCVRTSEYAHECCDVEPADKVLARSDIIILTLPLTDQTRYFFNQDRLSCVRDGAVLINISRGAVIDEAALVEKIKQEKFLGVALDVFEEEPLPKNSPLWGVKNVLITPHNSFVSDKVADRLYTLIRENLSRFIKINGL